MNREILNLWQAFDVVDSKVGKDLSEAIFAEPNNTVKIANVEESKVIVEKGEVLDGLGRHYRGKVQVSDKPPESGQGPKR